VFCDCRSRARVLGVQHFAKELFRNEDAEHVGTNRLHTVRVPGSEAIRNQRATVMRTGIWR
jgi:hypothetical protein